MLRPSRAGEIEPEAVSSVASSGITEEFNPCCYHRPSYHEAKGKDTNELEIVSACLMTAQTGRCTHRSHNQSSSHLVSTKPQRLCKMQTLILVAIVIDQAICPVEYVVRLAWVGIFLRGSRHHNVDNTRISRDTDYHQTE